MKSLRTPILCTIACLLGAFAVLVVRDRADAQQKKKDPPPVVEYKSGIVWPEPALVTPGKDNGSAVRCHRALRRQGPVEVERRRQVDHQGRATRSPPEIGITTKDAFGDCQLHVEFATPDEVKGSGQGRGNSGVYFMGRYEVQILDSYENKTYFDGQCASLYKQHPPLVNACRKPGEWQTYDIIFESPRFDADKKLTRPGYVTVLHNGIVVQNHFELLGGTFYDQPAEVHGTPAARADSHSVPRQPGEVPQHLDPRVEGDRGHEAIEGVRTD